MNALIALYVSFLGRVSTLRDSKKGQTLVEYALILVLIALVAIVAMTTIGHKVSNTFISAGTNLAS